VLCDDLGMLNRFSEKGVCSSHTLLPVVARGFFLPLSGDQDAKPTPAGEVSGIKWGVLREAPLFCVIPWCMTAFGCLLLFFYAGSIYLLLLPIAVP